MELMYKVEWPGSLNEVSFGHSGKFKCAWSSLNLVAFTSEKFEKGKIYQLYRALYKLVIIILSKMFLHRPYKKSKRI